MFINARQEQGQVQGGGEVLLKDFTGRERSSGLATLESWPEGEGYFIGEPRWYRNGELATDSKAAEMEKANRCQAAEDMAQCNLM